MVKRGRPRTLVHWWSVAERHAENNVDTWVDRRHPGRSIAPTKLYLPVFIASYLHNSNDALDPTRQQQDLSPEHVCHWLGHLGRRRLCLLSLFYNVCSCSSTTRQQLLLTSVVIVDHSTIILQNRHNVDASVPPPRSSCLYGIRAFRYVTVRPSSNPSY